MTRDSVPLDAEHLGAYFALMEASSLLQRAVEKQLRTDGGLSYVQFQILARLGDAPGGQLRMTDLADSVVYSRSGLTYQAGQLDRAGLVTRTGGQDDERCVVVTITAAGRALVARVLPGHVEIVQQLLFLPLNSRDVTTLCRVLSRIRDHIRAAPPRSADTRS